LIFCVIIIIIIIITERTSEAVKYGYCFRLRPSVCLPAHKLKTY